MKNVHWAERGWGHWVEYPKFRIDLFHVRWWRSNDEEVHAFTTAFDHHWN